MTVEVQDKANPIINCPADMTIDCRDRFDDDNMDALFGTAYISDNCSVDVPQQVVDTDFNQCGVGLMTRTLQVLSPDGSVVASCKQLITIENENPFVASDIIWPQDLEVTNLCDVDLLTPDLLEAPFSFPQFAAGSQECTLLGFDYEDQVFSSNPTTGECAVIQRTWTVINWCNDSNSGTFLNPVPQIIKINNETSPELDEGLDLLFTGQTVDCNSGLVEVTRTAIDDCQNDLIWDYTLRQFPSGNIIQKGSSNSISGKYPVGNYTIDWRVFDGCGNSDFHTQSLSIQSNKAPTPVCHNGLSATLIGWDTNGDGTIDTEQVELWASDFNAGSYPNCGNDVAFSFSRDTTDKFTVFDCSHIGRNNVNMWVTDVVTGAQDFCTAFIDIQDQGDCPDANSVVVAGSIETEMAQMIESVSVVLDNSNNIEVTNAAGSYAFGSLSTGSNFEIIPKKDDDYLNGVSTLDLIMIQRHILGIEPLDSPYKIIAADVDGNQMINGVDLVELRKLILGIYVDLPNNDSWRFVSSDYQFLNDLDPWVGNIDETYEIFNLSNNMVVDFIGVKIGDVNTSAITSLVDDPETRSVNQLRLNATHEMTSQNDINSIIISSDTYEDIRGWQATFDYNSDLIDILDVVPVNLDLDLAKNVSIDENQSVFTMSYDSKSTTSVSSTEGLYEIVYKAKQDLSGKEELIQISSGSLQAEAYDSDLNVLDLSMNMAQLAKSEIISVSPNPFVNEAVIDFYNGQEGTVLFEFYDINGKQLYSTEMLSEIGRNSIRVTRDQINGAGFIYVRMSSGDSISEYRMVIL